MHRRIVKSFLLAVFFAITPQALADDVGLVDTGTGEWHLRNTDGSSANFYFGNPGDFPIAGDWDCNGSDTPGLYRQSDGFVYLRNSNSQGVADTRFFFGNPGDVPLAGDFDGDGCDTVSIYRPSESRIYVINELGANDGGLGAAEFNYLFGNPGDKPFVGDFNGDAIDTVGLHRESTGLVYFRQSHTQGIADAEFIFGDPGDRLVTGDWGVVDGSDTPALFRPSNATFYFRYTNTQGVADEVLAFGFGEWLPVSGDWDAPPLNQTSKDESGTEVEAGDGGPDTGLPTDDAVADTNHWLVEPSTVEPTHENITALLAAAASSETPSIGIPELLSAWRDNLFGTQHQGSQPLWGTQATGYLAYSALPSAVGYLEFYDWNGVAWSRLDTVLGGPAPCSATVISRDIIVTAAHCLGADGYVFYPDKWGTEAKYGAWGGTQIRVPQAYNDAFYTDSFGIRRVAAWFEAFDFAFIKLEPNSLGQHIGDVVGTVRVLYNAQAAGVLPRRAIGYPAEGWFGTSAAANPCTWFSKPWVMCVPYFNQTTSTQGQDKPWGNGWYSFGMGAVANGGMSGGPVLAWYQNRWHIAGVVSNGGSVVSCWSGVVCNSTRNPTSYYMRNLWSPVFRSGNFLNRFEYEWAQALNLP